MLLKIRKSTIVQCAVPTVSEPIYIFIFIYFIQIHEN